MRAVTFNVSIPGFLVGKALGGVTEAALFGALSGVRYGEVAEPSLPADDWVKLDVLAAGVCGTDVSTLTFNSSTSMEPFGSFPAVLGHEILGRVTEVGPAVRRVEVGQRVVVDPFISCTMRGFSGGERCGSCQSGLHCTCERAGDSGSLRLSDEPFPRGTIVGYHAGLPGGWGERTIAHERHLFPVDDALSDRTAALIEPLSIGMHAVLNVRPFGAGPVLVIGSGPIALGTIWSLRAAGYEKELLAQLKPSHEAALSSRPAPRPAGRSSTRGRKATSRSSAARSTRAAASRSFSIASGTPARSTNAFGTRPHALASSFSDVHPKFPSST